MHDAILGLASADADRDRRCGWRVYAPERPRQTRTVDNSALPPKVSQSDGEPVHSRHTPQAPVPVRTHQGVHFFVLCVATSSEFRAPSWRV